MCCLFAGYIARTTTVVTAHATVSMLPASTVVVVARLRGSSTRHTHARAHAHPVFASEPPLDLDGPSPRRCLYETTVACPLQFPIASRRSRPWACSRTSLTRATTLGTSSGGCGSTSRNCEEMPPLRLPPPNFLLVRFSNLANTQLYSRAVRRAISNRTSSSYLSVFGRRLFTRTCISVFGLRPFTRTYLSVFGLRPFTRNGAWTLRVPLRRFKVTCRSVGVGHHLAAADPRSP